MFYADQVLNSALCNAFTEEMALMGDKFLPMAKETLSSATDMGNVSHVVPSFHCSYGIDSGDAANHQAGFTAAAATPDALDRAVRVGKGLAMLGLRVLLDGDFSKSVKDAFERPCGIDTLP
jgi:metal-dependent amidase/aminoacylase/carboxypeptidase family protein